MLLDFDTDKALCILPVQARLVVKSYVADYVEPGTPLLVKRIRSELACCAAFAAFIDVSCESVLKASYSWFKEVTRYVMNLDDNKHIVRDFPHKYLDRYGWDMLSNKFMATANAYIGGFVSACACHEIPDPPLTEQYINGFNVIATRIERLVEDFSWGVSRKGVFNYDDFCPTLDSLLQHLLSQNSGDWHAFLKYYLQEHQEVNVTMDFNRTSIVTKIKHTDK